MRRAIPLATCAPRWQDFDGICRYCHCRTCRRPARLVVMNEFTRRRGGPRRRLTSSVVRLIRQGTAILRELNEAQRPATSRPLSPPPSPTAPHRPPRTHREVLFRCPTTPP